MRLIAHDETMPADWRRPVVAIGNFDGVHRGHQAVVNLARETARRLAAPLGAITFEPHPRSVFNPASPVFRLSPLALKARLLAGLGCDFVAPLDFTRALAAIEAERFVQDILVERFAIAHIVAGYDFHFGHGRKGNPGLLAELGRHRDFAVSVVEQVTDGNGLAPFSSSSIRAALRHGDVAAAAERLGYWWSVIGTVVEGDRRGRIIGFPTANIVLDDGAEPREGIYAVRVRRLGDGAGPGLEGAAYVGRRPTFDSERRFLEIHLLDFSGDLYGARLLVEFVGFIRPDQQFSSVEALVARMSDDCAAIRTLLAGLRADDPMRRHPLGRLQAEGRL
jgi:riboflavin kinase/FMN adenylyltransferase